jgi:hypothetical protein
VSRTVDLSAGSSGATGSLTVRQYVDALRPVAVEVGRALGEDIAVESTEDRIVLNLIMGMVCVLVKMLVDGGAITTVQISAAYTAFLDDPSSYPDVPPAPAPYTPAPD